MTHQTEWYPGDIFSSSPNIHKAFALIVLNQPLELRVSFYRKVWQNAICQVAADGGANRLHDLIMKESAIPLKVDTIIGDLDSLRHDVRNYWLQTGSEILHDSDQESTDFGKATKYLKSFKVPDDAEFTASM